MFGTGLSTSWAYPFGSLDATFTPPYGTPFQTELTAFAPGGSGAVTDTYDARITVTEVAAPAAVPEPASLASLGTGLIAVGARR